MHQQHRSFSHLLKFFHFTYFFMLCLYPEMSLSLLSRASISIKLLLFLPLASAQIPNFSKWFPFAVLLWTGFGAPFCPSVFSPEHTSLLLSAFHSSPSWCQGHSAPGFPQHVAHNSAMICWVSATCDSISSCSLFSETPPLFFLHYRATSYFSAFGPLILWVWYL